jgi:hypothetical protein
VNDLTWKEIEEGFKGLFDCKSTNIVKKSDITSAKKMIKMIRSNEDYPIDKLDRYEKRLNKWLKEIEKRLKVIEIRVIFRNL